MEHPLNRRALLQLCAGVSLTAFLSRGAEAQPGYPDHIVKLIVPRPSGGVVDIIARAWSEKVGKTLGATYIENMGGGGGTIGAVAAARAPADGYTLFFGTTSEMVLSPILTRQSYDPIAGFEPIAIICDSVAAIVVNPSVPAANLNELVAYAQKNRGIVNYGSAGVGTVSNLAGELFKRLADLPDITHIPYKGGGQAMSDLIGGQVPIATPMMSESIVELHRHGQIRIVAVASERRLAAMPDIATAAEQGFPELVARLFVGLFAPAKTPRPILAKVEDATQMALQDPALQASFAAGGFERLTNSDAASAADYLKKDIARWKPLLEQLSLNRQ